MENHLSVTLVIYATLQQVKKKKKLFHKALSFLPNSFHHFTNKLSIAWNANLQKMLHGMRSNAFKAIFTLP